MMELSLANFCRVVDVRRANELHQENFRAAEYQHAFANLYDEVERRRRRQIKISSRVRDRSKIPIVQCLTATPGHATRIIRSADGRPNDHDMAFIRDTDRIGVGD